jgi:peptidoglycan hydrolase-like protein with peptidoglycan-binding domain
MKNILIAGIPNYIRVKSWYCLLLLTTTPVFITSSAFMSIAAPFKIAQVNTEVQVNRPPLNLGSQGQTVAELQAALKILGFYSGAVDGTYQQSTVIAVAQFQQAAGLNPNGNVDNITWQKLFPNPSNILSSSIVSPPPQTASSFTTVPTQRTNNPIVNNSLPPTVIPPTVTPPTLKPPTPKPPTPKPPTPKNQPNTSIQPTPLNQQVPGIQYTPEGWPILRLGMSGTEVVKLQKQLKNLGFLTGAIDGDFGVITEIAVKDAQVRYGLKPDGVVGGGTWKVFLKRTSGSR